MSKHPYQNLPDHAFWRKSMAEIPGDAVDPVVSAGFKIGRSDLVATAGSCFAQHIARHLQSSGFSYFVSEKPHPMMPQSVADAHQYGTYTARYGNVYTARQLNQLFKRAYGLLVPVDTAWQRNDGRWVDPFRPQIQPDGFSTPSEVESDRTYHLGRIRKAFEELDIFVFTLGLTETWMSRADGAVFPICPGVAGGAYDPERYAFKNFKVAEITQDLIDFAGQLKIVNPKAKILVTVSPVPLIATAADHHVLVSTTYSKSALRVACEEFAEAVANATYFPSYEVITGNHSRGRYFAPDLRSVTEEGVSHVMRLLLKHYTDAPQCGSEAPASDGAAPLSLEEVKSRDHLRDLREIVNVVCDEEALDRH